MDLNEYQRATTHTAIYPPAKGLEYTVLGLASEAGEVAGKLKKYLRDGGSLFDLKEDMTSELGDVLWYVARVAAEFGLSLDTIAVQNLGKLGDRKARGELGGSGDDR